MDIERWWTIPTNAINKTTFPFTLSTFNPFNLFNQRTPMKRLALLLPLLALAAAPARAEDPATKPY